MLQQLYMLGGLLVIYASVNTFTLKSLTHVARIGASWQVAGEPAHHNQHILGLLLHIVIRQPTLVCQMPCKASAVQLGCCAGAFVIAVTLLFVAEKRQKWSWVLTDFEVSTVARIWLYCFMFNLALQLGSFV